jgi:hypothetical protein
MRCHSLHTYVFDGIQNYFKRLYKKANVDFTTSFGANETVDVFESSSDEDDESESMFLCYLL